MLYTVTYTTWLGRQIVVELEVPTWVKDVRGYIGSWGLEQRACKPGTLTFERKPAPWIANQRARDLTWG